jgi:HEAT repeat protein
LTTLLLACISTPPAQASPPPARYAGGAHDAEPGLASEPEQRQEELYDEGTEAMDEGQWDRALEMFTKAAELKGSRTDGAVYWKAYTQNRLGQRAEALTTLELLRRNHPQSHWLNDAKALEIEVRQSSGQPVAPEREQNEELKLMALNGLANSDPERAIPMLESLLQSNNSPKLKDRALFVLAQSHSTRAREMIAKIARGGATPDLQMRALRYLGLFGGQESRKLLSDIYSSSSDVSIKKAILRSFMTAGERDRLVAAAKGEPNPQLRTEAVRQLGVMQAESELTDLYRSEASVDVKKQIIQAMFVGGSVESLTDLARNEKDAELRRTAIRSLGVAGSRRAGDTLVSIYGSDKDPTIRKEVINGLFVQNNAHALVELARKETDPHMKKEIVSRLSLMNSKEAKDYILELLKD